jgi:hypothetical protein
MKLTITICENEFWWGGSVAEGIRMPYDLHTDFFCDYRYRGISNQTMPLFLSSHGRYIWS